MPIRFISNIVNPTNTDDVIVPEGEVAILVKLSKGGDSEYKPSSLVHPSIKDIVITIKRITISGNPTLDLPATPYVVPAIMEQAAKRARNDPESGGSSKQAHKKFVHASKWPFVPAWSMRITDARNMTLHTHLSVNIYPLRLSDPKAMMMLYTALSRARMCTQIRFQTTVAKLRQEQEPVDGHEADAEEEV